MKSNRLYIDIIIDKIDAWIFYSLGGDNIKTFLVFKQYRFVCEVKTKDTIIAKAKF